MKYQVGQVISCSFLSDLQKTLAVSKGLGYLVVETGATHDTINKCTTCTTWGSACVGAKDGNVIYYDGKNVVPVGTLKDLLSQAIKAGY